MKLPAPVWQEPDEAGTPAPVDPPADAPVVDPVEAVETPVDPPEPPQEQRVPISVVTGLRAKSREQEAEIARLSREANDAKALAERLANGNNQPPAPPTSDDADVDRRADFKLFLRDVETMRGDGLRDFGPAFNDTIRILNAVGADDNSFVSQVMAVDRANAHKLLTEIAKEPERAIALVQMDPTRRIAELTRISMATAKTPVTPASTSPTTSPPVSKTTPKTVSKAPPPAPPVEPSASKVVDWRTDDASDDDFTAGFQEMMKRRSAKR